MKSVPSFPGNGSQNTDARERRIDLRRAIAQDGPEHDDEEPEPVFISRPREVQLIDDSG